MITKSIHEAILAEVNELSSSSAEFVIKPLYYGYGNTLGNSFRRVLLSSIKGAAITAFSIEGTNHEYSAIEGIVEDVVDIALNLKNIKLKSHSDETIELELNVKGSDLKDLTVTAKDIKLPAEVEVANPDQIICHLASAKSNLKMRFAVNTGVGYLSIGKSGNERKNKAMIALDAVFSPVVRVRYKVENTRVGQDINLQQLTLTIDTDGTISPKEAFEIAAATLKNQYASLAGSTTVAPAPAPGKNSEEMEELMARTVEEAGFSVRTCNSLKTGGIKTLGDLYNISDAELKELKGFGTKAEEEVRAKRKELGV